MVRHCLQAHVRLLSEAHYVNSSDLGIPRAEQDAEGELLLGVCRQCQVTRLLSSLEEHEAGCKPLPAPVPVPKQPASGTACLPAASEGLPSVSQVSDHAPVALVASLAFAWVA